LENLLQELNQSCDRVIYLEVPDEVLTERLHERGRKDDSQATIRKRLEVYRNQTVPLVDFYRERSLLKTVNGDLPMQDVTKSLKQLVES
jgi:adenylate kinase